MDELLEQFLIEGRELAGEAHGAVRTLQSKPEDRAAIDALFRILHTLKGSVALFDMASAEQVLHASEALLAQLKKNDGAPSGAQRDALVAVIDQVDRWIDEVELNGKLSDASDSIASDLIVSLGNDDDAGIADAARDVPWLTQLLTHPRLAASVPASGATAFRYVPDAECFFRGDDPLATIAAVPDLRAFVILPAAEWPSLDTIDPFQCVCVVEGVSGADVDAVKAAFRLVPDQVVLSRVGNIGAAPVGVQASEVTTVLRVEGKKLDRLARQAGELVIAVHGLDGLAERTDGLDRSLAADIRRAHSAIESASGALRASIADVRLVSLGPVLRRLPRLAREVASGLGKEIEFSIAGETTEADKQIADGLFEPLLHLVRNAIDHGIEAPGDREAAGKPPRGKVVLTIASSGDRLVVTLSDDGRGIDPERLRRSAISKGLMTTDAAAALSDAQATRLIFTPGFSTAQAVTDVSGRGVGMDAVQKAVERLQGSIDVESVAGSGTTLRISLPLNAITTRLLTVSAGGELYGLRMDQIAETIRVDAADIHAVGQGEACVVRDRTVPVMNLGQLLGHACEKSAMARLVLTEVTGELIAVRVDALGERLDARVRERTGLLSAVPAIGGTAVLGDGGVLLVLDLPELIQ